MSSQAGRAALALRSCALESIVGRLESEGF